MGQISLGYTDACIEYSDPDFVLQDLGVYSNLSILLGIFYGIRYEI